MKKTETERLARAIADDCIGGRIRLLNRVITNLYDRALQPLGITVNQASILVMLSLANQVTAADIGKKLLMEKSTVSRNLDRMKRNGWIEIQTANNSVAQIVTVTVQGESLLTATHTEWAKAQKQAEVLLGKEGVLAVRMLHSTLGKKR